MRKILFLILLLAVMGCATGNTQFSRYKGTDGLLISFVENAPPDTVYEARPFPVKISIHDAGAFDVNNSEMIVNFSYDPLYLTGGTSIFDIERYDIKSNHIKGRSLTYPQGEERIYSVPSDYSFATKPVYGQREMPETTLTASVCYKYTTYASSPVCIDTNFYDENQRDQACEAKDIAYSGGQGAPIAIEKIEVRMLPSARLDSVRPEFLISVRDVGEGYLIGPDTLEMSSACLLKGIPREQLNAVLITAWLRNTKLECGPEGAEHLGESSGIIKLIDKQGKISCTVPENELSNPNFLVKQNYQSMITINVTYLYKASASKKLTIERVGDIGAELPPSGVGKASGYLYVNDQLYLDEAGRSVTLCSFYASNPKSVPETFKGRISSDYSCSCGNERCLKLSRDGRCVFGDVCPSNTYCCNDQKSTAATGGYLPEAVLADPETPIPKVGAAPSKQEINSMLEALSRKYGIPADYLKAIAYKESTWTCNKLGDGGKSYGLMQIYTVAHPKYQVQTGKEECSYNAEYGAAFFASLYQQYHDWPTAIMRYNGGGSAAAAYRDDAIKKAQEKPWTTWL